MVIAITGCSKKKKKLPFSLPCQKRAFLVILFRFFWDHLVVCPLPNVEILVSEKLTGTTLPGGRKQRGKYTVDHSLVLLCWILLLIYVCITLHLSTQLRPATLEKTSKSMRRSPKTLLLSLQKGAQLNLTSLIYSF